MTDDLPDITLYEISLLTARRGPRTEVGLKIALDALDTHLPHCVRARADGIITVEMTNWGVKRFGIPSVLEQVSSDSRWIVLTRTCYFASACDAIEFKMRWL